MDESTNEAKERMRKERRKEKSNLAKGGAEK